MGELGRRRRQAGGWATEKTERDKDYILGFGGEDEEPSDGPSRYRPAPRPQGDTPPGGIGALEDEETEAARQPPPRRRAAARTRGAQPPAQVRRPAPAQVLDDEDDFSNQSSWMRNQ